MEKKETYKMDKEVMLVEYSTTHDAFMHQDNFSLQVGSILIAGGLIFWGLILDEKMNEIALKFGLFIETLLMTIWILYSHHTRQIYLWKLYRLREIEENLGMKSNLNFVKRDINNKKPIYRTYFPSGNQLNLTIYCLISLGPAFIFIPTKGWPIWIIAQFGIVVVILLWIIVNESRIKKRIEEKAKARNQ